MGPDATRHEIVFRGVRRIVFGGGKPWVGPANEIAPHLLVQVRGYPRCAIRDSNPEPAEFDPPV